MLPHTLAAVDLEMKCLRPFHRVRPSGARVAADGSGWAEHRLEDEYDRLFVNCLAVIEELLRKSGDIDPTSKLKLLSDPPQQVLKIDILLAEVGPDPNNEFRRLVLVEDKLATNSESRREVLAQILEYAHTVQTKLRPRDLSTSVVEPDWIEDNEDEINRAMRSGDYLLIICGDHIRQHLVALLQSYVDRLNPVNASNVVLIEMAIYSDGDVRVFVPHIVGGSARATRDITVRVKVETADGSPLTVSSVETEATSTGPTGPRVIPPAAFEAGFVQRFGPQAAQAWRTLAEAAVNSGIPGIGVANYDGGAPYIYLSNTPLGPVHLLRLADSSPVVRDRLNTAIWDSSGGAQRVREQFRNALLKGVPNASVGGKVGRVNGPVQDFANARQVVIEAIKVLVADLQSLDEMPQLQALKVEPV